MKNYNKALVLGSTGQGGSFMVKHLLKKGYYVYAFVRKSATGNLQNLENVINHKRLKIVHGDLIDLVSLEQIIKKNKFNEIYNFADQDHVKWSFEISCIFIFSYRFFCNKYFRNNQKFLP